MVGFEVVDLFSEEELPEVFAEKFNYVEGCRWAGFVAGESRCRHEDQRTVATARAVDDVGAVVGMGYEYGELPFNDAQSNSVPQPLQSMENSFSRFFLVHVCPTYPACGFPSRARCACAICV